MQNKFSSLIIVVFSLLNRISVFKKDKNHEKNDTQNFSFSYSSKVGKSKTPSPLMGNVLGCVKNQVVGTITLLLSRRRGEIKEVFDLLKVCNLIRLYSSDR